MLRNLAAEMARSGVAIGTVAQTIKKSKRKVKDTIDGKYSFNVDEAFEIRDELFPGMALEYLFARDAKAEEKGA